MPGLAVIVVIVAKALDLLGGILLILTRGHSEALILGPKMVDTHSQTKEFSGARGDDFEDLAEMILEDPMVRGQRGDPGAEVLVDLLLGIDLDLKIV